MKKTRLGLAILTSVLVIVFLLEPLTQLPVVDANPIPWRSTPNLDKPTITIWPLQNNTAYNFESVKVNFTVTKPDSWKMYMHVAPYIGSVGSPKVYLDGNEISNYITDTYHPQESIRSYNYSAVLDQLSLGLHVLNVTVLSYTYYTGSAYNNTHILSSIQSSSGPIYEYPIVVSEIVYFTIGQQTAPSPSPSLSPIAIASLTSNNSISGLYLVSTQVFLVVLGIAFGLILFVLIAVFYKRQKKVSEDND